MSPGDEQKALFDQLTGTTGHQLIPKWEEAPNAMKVKEYVLVNFVPDETHVSIFNDGPAAWNRWRNENPDVIPKLNNGRMNSQKSDKYDLTKVELNVTDLTKADLSGANLSEAMISEADIRHGRLRNAILHKAYLARANISGAACSLADFSEADLTEAILEHTDLCGATLVGAILKRAVLSNAMLHCADLRLADFTGADLSSADLSEAILTDANFSRANLKNADLSKCQLSKVQLEDADLEGAKLNSVVAINEHYHRFRFKKVDFRNAVLTGTSFQDGVFDEANFAEANLDQTDFSDALLEGTDLSGATLTSANLSRANLSRSRIHKADLQNSRLLGTNLTQAKLCATNLASSDLSMAILVETDLSHAILDSCRVYGISVWNVVLEGTSQTNLLITKHEEATVTTDNLEVAQFIHLLLNHQKLRTVITTVSNRAVLISGRFDDGGINILRCVAEKLRAIGYLPIIFDFNRPQSRNYTETIMVLAGLSRFVVVDLSGPSVPQELYATVPHFQIPFVPIIEKGKKPYAMYKDLMGYQCVISPPLQFDTIEDLIDKVPSQIVKRAEQQCQERQLKLRELFGE